MNACDVLGPREIDERRGALRAGLLVTAERRHLQDACLLSPYRPPRCPPPRGPPAAGRVPRAAAPASITIRMASPRRRAPAPGALSTDSVPPAAAARSANPSISSPRAASAPPMPSSETSVRSMPPLRCSERHEVVLLGAAAGIPPPHRRPSRQACHETQQVLSGIWSSWRRASSASRSPGGRRAPLVGAGKRVDRSPADLAAVGRCCVGIAAETRDDPTHRGGSLRSCTGRVSYPAAARSRWVNAPAGASVRSTAQLHLDAAHRPAAGFLALHAVRKVIDWWAAPAPMREVPNAPDGRVAWAVRASAAGGELTGADTMSQGWSPAVSATASSGVRSSWQGTCSRVDTSPFWGRASATINPKVMAAADEGHPLSTRVQAGPQTAPNTLPSGSSDRGSSGSVRTSSEDAPPSAQWLVQSPAFLNGADRSRPRTGARARPAGRRGRCRCCRPWPPRQDQPRPRSPPPLAPR